MDVRYQFFISSTFEDLREERQQVVQAILEHGHIPVGMEILPSADEAPWSIIEKTIEESDYYIVLSAGRYGNQFEGGLSFTEREFDYAVSREIPILGFLRHAPFDLPAAMRDDDEDKRHRLLNFQAKIKQKYVRSWHSVEELGLLVSRAVSYAARMQPRTGWIRADKARSTADMEKIESLRAEIDALNKRIEELDEENQEFSEVIRSTVLPDEDITPELLAQGDDLVEIEVVFKRGDTRYRQVVKATWDECLVAIGPEIYGVIHWAPYNGKYEFDSKLVALLRRKLDDLEIKSITFDKAQMDKILFQFKQLGLVSMRNREQDGRIGWSLTPLGEAHLTRAMVRLRDPENV